MYKEKPLYEIAKEIRKDWQKVNFAARPYLDAMGTIESIHSMYGVDTGWSIVAYFLCNANTWKGEKARLIKKELNRRLKNN